jgi:hypothetical protein
VARSTRVAATNDRFPLSLSANRRFLIDASGKPLFLLGDTAWSLIAQLRREEAELYLDDRRARGFNAILVNLLEHRFADNAPRNAYGHAPFLSAAFDQPCEEYFRHADWILTRACAKGIAVFLVYAYLGYEGGDQGWARELQHTSPETCRRFGAFLGHRYANLPNLVWVAGGDAAPDTLNLAPQVNALVDGIRSAGARQLHTAHSRRHRSACDDFNAAWLDLNTTYSDCDQALARLRLDGRRTPTLPFLLIEGRYENEGASPTCLRAQAYWTLLTGGCGYFFGNLPVWGFGAGFEAGGRDWFSALDSPGVRSLSLFAQLVRAWPWHRLQPDTQAQFLRDGPREAVAAFSVDDKLALIYMPKISRIRLDARFLSDRPLLAVWYRPQDGRCHRVETVAPAAELVLDPPPGDDALALLARPSSLIEPCIPTPGRDGP